MVSGRQKLDFDSSFAEGFDASVLPRSIAIDTALADHLRKHIIMASLKPGDPVPELGVGNAFNLGRSHVRGALRILEGEHLIKRIPQSGSYVSPISPSLVRQGGFLRLAVEEANIRELAEHPSEELIVQLRGQIERQNAATRGKDRLEFHLQDEAFHASLFEATGRGFAWSFLQPAKLHIDRARIATLGLSASPDRAIAEHSAIVDAVADSNPKAACNAMRTHLERINELLANLAKLEPTFVDKECN